MFGFESWKEKDILEVNVKWISKYFKQMIKTEWVVIAAMCKLIQAFLWSMLTFQTCVHVERERLWNALKYLIQEKNNLAIVASVM